MGMSSKGKKISKDGLEAMDIRKVVESEEKCITRSQIKDEKVLEVHHNPHYTPKNNKLGKDLAEVFRTDFITAMKIPDSQQLPPGEYLPLKDTWRQEWEKGVQVPVNPDKIKKAVIRDSRIKFTSHGHKPYELPPERIKFDEKKYLECIDRGNTSCNYDLDDVDMEWLKEISSLRALKKGKQATAIDALTMERALTWFERECFEKMAHAVATKEGLSIEYDESTTCDVCLSPDAEDGNEIIFCDACNMCVHQHCYGILEIPEGNWLCNPCSRGMLSPPCCLCPAKGGAMKRIKDSYEWIHVICAWWVPEVKIEDVKFIERIRKDKIPPSRWNLLCCICREKSGACIQCSVKRCVKAYHVTCGVKEGLEIKTVVVPDKDDVQHISFCSKHCTPVPPEQNPHRNRSGEEIENNRFKELRKLESEFYSLVSVPKAARELKLPKESTRRLLSYWTMKRRENENAPLIPLTLEQQEKLSGKQGVVLLAQQKTLEMERFLHLRQDLERLRNLCYMIVRREKLRKELHRTAVDIFYKQNDILLDSEEDLSGDKLDFIRHRSTRFSKFSEHYVTEKDYETEHGSRLTIFDSTAEDEETLLNNSHLEIFDEKDVQRGETDTNNCASACRGKKKMNNKHDTVSSTATTADATESRNIFQLFATKKEEELEDSGEACTSQTIATKQHEEEKLGQQDTEWHEQKLATPNINKTKEEDEEKRHLVSEIQSRPDETLKMKKRQTLINFKPVEKDNGKECDEVKTDTKKENNLFENMSSILEESFHCDSVQQKKIRENGHAATSHDSDVSELSDVEDVTEIFNRKNAHRSGGSSRNTSRNYSTPTKRDGRTTTNSRSPKFKTSSLAERGKRRFRNLHDISETQIRRNSPRLHKVSENDEQQQHNEVTAFLTSGCGGSGDDGDSKLAGRFSSPSKSPTIEQDTKRRRLNSCGESFTENEEDNSSSSSYMPVRITRSRVSSYS